MERYFLLLFLLRLAFGLLEHESNLLDLVKKYAVSKFNCVGFCFGEKTIEALNCSLGI